MTTYNMSRSSTERLSKLLLEKSLTNIAILEKLFPQEDKKYPWYIAFVRWCLRMPPERVPVLRKLPIKKGETVKFIRPHKFQLKGENMEPKTLHNSDVSGARKNVSDINVYGNGDMFQLLGKASSEKEGWMKSTKAMEIENVGCVVQVTTQQKNPDGSYSVAEALTFIPKTYVSENVIGDRELKPLGHKEGC